MGKNAAGAWRCSRPSSRRVSNALQVVVKPGVNDGAELMRTPAGIERYLPVCFGRSVPLGYTRHQKRFRLFVFPMIPMRLPRSSSSSGVPGGFRRRTAQSPPRKLPTSSTSTLATIFRPPSCVRGLPAVPGWHRYDAPRSSTSGTDHRLTRGDGRASGRRTRGVHCLRNGVRPRSEPPSRALR